MSSAFLLALRVAVLDAGRDEFLFRSAEMLRVELRRGVEPKPPVEVAVAASTPLPFGHRALQTGHNTEFFAVVVEPGA